MMKGAAVALSFRCSLKRPTRGAEHPDRDKLVSLVGLADSCS